MLRSAFVLSLLALSSVAGAQSATPGTEPMPHYSPALGLHWGSPLRTSVTVGLLADMNGKQNDGIIAALEAGLQGGEASFGYYRMFGWFGSGYSVRAAVLRTLDEPWNANEHTTYVGGELHGMLIFGIGGRVGFMRRVSSHQTGSHDTLIPVGLSIGF